MKTNKMNDKYMQRRYKRSSKISVLLFSVVKILSFYHPSRSPVFSCCCDEHHQLGKERAYLFGLHVPIIVYHGGESRQKQARTVEEAYY